MSTRDIVYDYIKKYNKEHGHSPAFREIGEAVGLKSTSNVHDHIKTLEAEGRIKRYQFCSLPIPSTVV